MNTIENIQIRVGGMSGEEAGSFARLLAAQLASRIEEARPAGSREHISIRVQADADRPAGELMEKIITQIMLELEGR